MNLIKDKIVRNYPYEYFQTLSAEQMVCDFMAIINQEIYNSYLEATRDHNLRETILGAAGAKSKNKPPKKPHYYYINTEKWQTEQGLM